MFAADCPQFDVINGSLSTSETRYLTSVTVTCDEGFELSGPGQLQCLADGAWSSSVPLCQRAGEASALSHLDHPLVILKFY